MPAFIGLLLIAPALIWKAYVVTILWAWFVSPTFALPNLGLATAVGLCALADLLFKRWSSDDKSFTWETLSYGVFMATFVPAATLVVAYCAVLAR